MEEKTLDEQLEYINQLCNDIVNKVTAINSSLRNDIEEIKSIWRKNDRQ